MDKFKVLIIRFKFVLKIIYKRFTLIADIVKHLKSVNYVKHNLSYHDFMLMIKDNLKINNFINFPDKNSLNSIKAGYSQIEFSVKNIINHEFDLLGSGKVKVKYNMETRGFEGIKFEEKLTENEINDIKTNTIGYIEKVINKKLDFNYEPIDWHIDFKSGYRWNKKNWYKKITFGNVKGADVKIPWELSRCSHFVVLGEAFLLTGDEKYSKEFVCQALDWLYNNPFQFGVNWACTMDVAIRACNWVVALSFFQNSRVLTKDFLIDISKSLYLHGVHIINNLEKGLLRIKNNHYIADLSGLLYIGTYFSFTDFGKKWINIATNELKKEISTQVYHDGTNFEASTCYHRLALELFFYPLLFSIKSSPEFNYSDFVLIGNKMFGKSYIEKIYDMFKVVAVLADSKGFIAQIGDNDNGMLHIFSETQIRDMRYLLFEAREFFKNSIYDISIFKFDSFKNDIISFFLFGKFLKEDNDLEKELIGQKIGLNVLAGSGWIVFKHKVKSDNYNIVIACGPNGQNDKGGHCHNDKLSFSLNINGIDIFVDPGTYVYTPNEEARNLFRSTGYHNTVMVDDKEQNGFIKNNIFYLNNDSKPRIIKACENRDLMILIGEHYGYIRNKYHIIHQRQYIFEKEKCNLFIKDIIKMNSSNLHKFDFNFIFSPHVNLKSIPQTYNFFIQYTKDNSLKLSLFGDTDFNCGIKETYYSDGYGKKCRTNSINYNCKNNLSFETFFAISRLEDEFDAYYIKKLFSEEII